MPILKVLMQSVKQQLSPGFVKSWAKVVTGYLTWIASTPFLISSWSAGKRPRKWNQKVALRWPCDPNQGQGDWKGHEVVETQHENNWLKPLHVMSIFKVFEMQSWRPARHNNTTDYIDLYVTYINYGASSSSVLPERDICVCDRFLFVCLFFNPTIEVVTFRLWGWCMLGVCVWGGWGVGGGGVGCLFVLQAFAV